MRVSAKSCLGSPLYLWGAPVYNTMKTIEELTVENHDLRELLRKTRDQLTKALDQVAEDHKAKGEWHHRQFAKMCPMPDMSQITLLK